MTDCGMWHCKQKVFTPLNPLWVGFVPIQQILIAVWAAEKARRMKPSSPGAPGEGGRLCWTGPGWMWSGSLLPCSAMIHGCPLPALSATVLLSSKPPRWWIPLKSYYFFPSDYFPVNPFLGSELSLCMVKMSLVVPLNAQRPKVHVGAGVPRWYLTVAAPGMGRLRSLHPQPKGSQGAAAVLCSGI